MNETCLNCSWIKADLTDERAQEFTQEVLNHMRDKLADYQEKYGDLYNLEATPAESTAFRLAKHDKKRFPDIITAGKEGETPYYTNSSHLPVGYTDDIFSALDIQDNLQTLYTSGTVFHAFLGEKMPDWKSAATLVRKIAENYRLPYYTLSPTYSVCKNHGYLNGEVWQCPKCGEAAEVYSRITGYYRPVQNWNDGKRQEYNERETYNQKICLNKDPKDKSNVYVKEVSAPVAKDVVVESSTIATPAATDTLFSDDVILFTAKTCPNCKMAKYFLDKAGISYRTVMAEDNQQMAVDYDIHQTPTLIVVNGDTAQKIENVSNIRKYAEKGV
jgi:ribonucleoside-triphosphate reductase